MAWIEMLDSVYMGWFGRWSVTLFVVGFVLMLIGGLTDAYNDYRDDKGFMVGALGAVMLLLVLGALALWLIVRLGTWAVTGQ